jgi:hypothetical protein
MCGLSKIDRTHVAIGADFFGSTFCEYRAADQNRDLLGKTKYQIHVMVDDQDADGFWQCIDCVKNDVAFCAGDSRSRFIEQQHLRLQPKRNGKLNQPLTSVR